MGIRASPQGMLFYRKVARKGAQKGSIKTANRRLASKHLQILGI
jgi:hypothetical protein